MLKYHELELRTKEEQETIQTLTLPLFRLQND